MLISISAVARNRLSICTSRPEILEWLVAKKMINKDLINKKKCADNEC